MNELKKREVQILKAVCQDKNNLEIAEQLGISLRTVEKAKLRLKEKTKTRSNVSLLKWAVINGFYTIKGRKA